MHLRFKISLSVVIIISIATLILLCIFRFNNQLYFEKGNSAHEIGKSQEISGSKYTIEYPLIGSKDIDSDINKVINKYKNQFKQNYSYVYYESYLGPDNTISIVFVKTLEKNNKIVSEDIDTYHYSLKTNKRLTNKDIFSGDYQDIIVEYIDKKIKNKGCNNKNIGSYKYALTNKNLKIYFNRNEVCEDIITIDIPYKDIIDYIKLDISKITTKKTIKRDLHLSEYKKVNKTLFIRELANVYEKDDKASHLLYTISGGKKVEVLKNNDQWSLIKYHEKVGYIDNDSLVEKYIDEDKFKDSKDKLYVLSNVELKEFADITSNSIDTLKKGTKVSQIAISDDGWSKIAYNDSYAYLYSSYLTKDKVDQETNMNRKIDKTKPVVALTFDDGPNPISTPRILDTLSKYEARATFFELGSLMTIHSDLVKLEEEKGNEIESHTFRHANLNKLSEEEIKADIAQSEQVFIDVLGHKPTVVRPPYGNANDIVKKTIPYPLINWNVDTLDWKSKNKDAILNEIRSVNDYNGKIILMHSIYPTTADAVEVLVPELIEKGYQLVTIQELAEYKGITLNAGTLYYNFD